MVIQMCWILWNEEHLCHISLICDCFDSYFIQKALYKL